ncbi:ATP-binding protein [Loktanella sp. SALINAS62]|uniref:ATP-binding protein n=1 Tax=Loktanella sp. SALINAS62 TaxID=2706124 RepID=UPI001B8C02D2|nr:ATP-binding protein [Loktanella sp. SALINAS62]MBS1300770.1 GAF domain-containing protein [Loktanella sp. SALINAS62]
MDEALTLRTLSAFAVDVIKIPSVEDLFWYVARNVVGRMNFIDCVIYQANDEQTELIQVAALGDKNPFDRVIINPLRIPFGQGITGQVAQTGQPIIVDDLLKDQNYIPDTEPARSEICVPLMLDGRVMGVIDSEHHDIGAFGDAELEILTTVAALTSAKLQLLAEVDRSDRRYRELVQSHAHLSDAISARKALETELFNARKLEAVGRLTGRFAHDFNNLLTVISGNLELIAGGADGAAFDECVQDAQAAAMRGAKLIRDMLAFSQKTHLDPVVTDLNALVRNVLATSGGMEPSDVVLDLMDGIWSVNVDSAGTEMALRNLLANADDAMPQGGTIRISTENTRHGYIDGGRPGRDLLPGRYVKLSVTDEGDGIPDAKVTQIFDPFYTTKPVGAGNGLGLSMVSGFMKQSGGDVAVSRNTPHGTTVTLFFPVASKEA